MATAVSVDIPKELQGDSPDDVLFSSIYGVRSIELNRPKKLNSLDASMARKIVPRLREWEKSDMANIIMISGAGEKAFCAGGDVAALAMQNKTKEGQKKSCDYFALEYKLDHSVATYSKPYIAIMDGITMGGGVGLSVHAPFRIATERTVFAMPETTIGFFPDVGGSFFLPRLDGEIGTYLALTSERLLGVQAFYAGIATHYVNSSVLGSLTTRLSELVFNDYTTLGERLRLVNNTIAEFISELPSPDSYERSPYGNLAGDLRKAIDRCFAFDSVEDVLRALEVESVSDEPGAMPKWAAHTLKTIQARSPTSLRVTLRQLREGKAWSIRETFIKEHTIASNFVAHPDFVEGVSARLIEKPARDPAWNPANLESITEKDVDTFFTYPEGIEQLQLLPPTKGGAPEDFHDYPHARFALPREVDIRDVVNQVGSQGQRGVMKRLLQDWNEKVGVLEKVKDVLARKTQVDPRNQKVIWKE